MHSAIRFGGVPYEFTFVVHYPGNRFRQFHLINCKSGGCLITIYPDGAKNLTPRHQWDDQQRVRLALLGHGLGGGGQRLAEHLAAEGRSHVTVSIGVACIHPAQPIVPATQPETPQDAPGFPSATEVAQALFEQADTALYNAKKAGRDRVMACPAPYLPLPVPAHKAG